MSLDRQILAAFHRDRETSLSGAELSRQLGVSRAAIWARIEALRQVGFDIEASPHKGYRLLSTPDSLIGDDLEARLPDDSVIGREIQVYRETNSTNDLVETLAQQGAREGLVIFAEAQNRGRGRQGRKWISHAGSGLWFSVLLRPPLPPGSSSLITVMAAVAVRRAIQISAGVLAQIKWPNDLLISGRKICGILTEMSAEPDRIKHAVLGIGLDVRPPSGGDLTEWAQVATSLESERDTPIDRPALAAELLFQLDRVYRDILGGRETDILQEWADHCITMGREVRVEWGQMVIEGRAESLDDFGALSIRNRHGRLERVTGGDVHLLS